jgi:hypothetical protein
MLRSGLMRNPVTSQPLAATPRMPATQQLSIVCQHSELKCTCFRHVHENGLEILMLWGKNKNVFVLFCNEPMPGQR